MVKHNTVPPFSHYRTHKKHANETVDRAILMADRICVNIRKYFEEYAQSQGVCLKYSGDFEQTWPDVGRSDLVHVFLNLVSHSFVYDCESATISVKTRRADKRGPRRRGGGSVFDLMLTVEGQGIGISPQNLAKLFHRFCRSQNRRISRAKLTSGLLYAKVVLDLKGGSINIESRASGPGKKIVTQFDFILTMAEHTRGRVRAYREAVAFDKHNNDIVVENILFEESGESVINSGNSTVNTSDDEFLSKLTALLECHVCDPDFNVSKLVSEIGMSRPVLFRKAKSLTGSSIINLIRSRRLKMAEMLLKQKKVAVSEVAFKVGYTDPKYFSKSFRSEFGKTPKEYAHALRA